MNRVQTQKDAITIRQSVYTDIKTNMDALQSAVQALITGQANYALGNVAKPTITSGTSGATVLTATTVDSTPVGEFDIAVTALAKAQTRMTMASATPDLALGKTGTFWIGGDNHQAASFPTGASASDTLTAVAKSDVATGQSELGTGTYSLQTRMNNGIQQFRLVDADGNAISIHSTDGSKFTSSWQMMTSGSLDTGRGLVLTLDSAGTTASTDLSYTAKGVSVDLSASDTQRTIATKINAAVQPDGHAFKASIVSGRLVLTGTQTGANHFMIFSDGAGIGFGADKKAQDGTVTFKKDLDAQSAQNASFTVNGMSISRATNTGLTDVIDGATINLALDATGNTAHLSIAASSDKATAAINDFVSKFNAAFTHLTNKMALTTSTTGTTTTYTRGPLAGDQGFRGLRSDLYNQLTRSVTNLGSFKSFADIGLSFDSNMSLKLDSTKFVAALKNNASDLTTLLDAGMGQYNTLLSRYAGSKGFVQSSLTSIDGQIKGYNQQIAKYTESLTTRRKGLIDQYFQYQSQLADIGYEGQMFGLNLNGSTSTSTINLLG